jgi:hypothetical protein
LIILFLSSLFSKTLGLVLLGYDYAKKVEARLVIEGVRSDEGRDAENERKRD